MKKKEARHSGAGRNPVNLNKKHFCLAGFRLDRRSVYPELAEGPE
jgi:hypothetical protein